MTFDTLVPLRAFVGRDSLTLFFLEGSKVGQSDTPALTCPNCEASIPLTRTVHRSMDERSLECPGCGQVTTWSVIDLRIVDVREAPEGARPAPEATDRARPEPD